MLNNLKKLIALDNPLRLFYHKIRAIIANFVYGFPSNDMTIIGITGTNGKTTTSNIIAKGLREAGKKVFMFSTVNIIINDKEYQNDTKMTSPDVFELQRLLKVAKSEGCEIAVIETASHGIKMHRVWGIEYDIAVLTNITQDHLDLHRTMEDYVHTKLKLFKDLIGKKRKPGIKKTGVINKNSKYSELFLAETYDNLFTYGNGRGIDLVAENITHNNRKTQFEVKIPGEVLKIETNLKGDFNIQNILASIGVFRTLGIDSKTISESIKHIDLVPGRFESVNNDLGIDIIVDYAHTEDALEKVLTTIKGLKGISRVITVFGATGDRDKTKRPTMGQIVEKYSDIIVLTQDDDYTENTISIIEDVKKGIKREEGDTFFIIPTRKQAIQTAILTAKENDLILVAGKGDEHLLITNDGPVKWHDKTVITEILEEL